MQECFGEVHMGNPRSCQILFEFYEVVFCRELNKELYGKKSKKEFFFVNFGTTYRSAFSWQPSFVCASLMA